MEYTYKLFDKNESLVLPDGKRYYDEINYSNIDYLRYFMRNPKWSTHEFIELGYTFSNYENISDIKTFSNPLVKLISDKGNLCKLTADTKLTPETFYFETIDGMFPPITDWYPEKDSVWFLKKCGDITYGGYDVFPLQVSKKWKAIYNINRLISQSNKIRRYHSNRFILQRSVINPMLMTSKNESDFNQYKFDIRAYGLLIKVPNCRTEFYLFKKYLIRRAMKPYNPRYLGRESQLTNTTQVKENDLDIAQFTSLGSDSINPNIYNRLFKAYSNLINMKLRDLDIDTIYLNPCISIIGLDYIFDSNNNVYLLEINKYPALHTDPEKREKFHHNLENSMFDDDFFKISFEAIETETVCTNDTKNWKFVD